MVCFRKQRRFVLYNTTILYTYLLEVQKKSGVSLPKTHLNNDLALNDV